MQSAETVLDILRERGRRGLPLDELYRQMFNPQLYLVAYGRLYSNKGALTPGPDAENADGMTLAKIGSLIDALRHERYQFKPVKRTYIPKKNGRRRPLGLPSWSDKLVAEVARMLLEAYYEPQFSDCSHGFRPGRGCHTALRQVAVAWTGTTWFIEGDISGCFDRLDRQVMLDALGEYIHDNRMLRLVSNMLAAGYLEDWVWNPTLSGVPQGGVASPILSNIYLHRLDTFVEKVLLPENNRGVRRVHNPAYQKVQRELAEARHRGDTATARSLRRKLRSLPTRDACDPGYRRLRYVRYADDTLLGFTGPKAEAEEIKRRLGQFLQDELKLELNQEKTLITHARSQRARFLGYEIATQHTDRFLTNGRRSANGVIGLKVPKAVIKAKCARHMHHGKPVRHRELTNFDDHAIIASYGAEYRGIVQYYLFAGDVARLSRLNWVMVTSMLKTLAGKYGSSVSKMARKYAATVETPYGPRRCFQVSVARGEGKKPLVARFGGIPLRRQKNAVLTDRVQALTQRSLVPQAVRHKELVARLLLDRCEVCGSTEGVQVHQVRKLADLSKAGQHAMPTWMTLMVRRRRKTLVVCRDCHTSIHGGPPATSLME